MPNYTETSISGLSYVNKDFNSVYSELLDLVKTLTTKWDPSVSNESDPGVVLTKLNALIADKNNYNIDKNILELFPLSVSQYGNARKIYDLLGYNMRWYLSATTPITFVYNGTENIGSNSVTLRALDTMVSDESGEVIYTLIEDCSLSSTVRTGLVTAIQGVVQQYEVNGVQIITLDNIDENNRIYFNESMIAENGIFVANVIDGNISGESVIYIGDGCWERVDNLESHELNSRIFKFGVLPTTNTCYIEFPQDIANLINEGLAIKYVVSSGENGNVSANTLNTFYNTTVNVEVTNSTNETETVDLTESIIITNAYAAVDGSDPESLESAYYNYKDTVGTFNTLVTCKDYETAINDLVNEREYLASNCVVSDRTNDINNTTYFMTQTVEDTVQNLLTNTNMDAFTIGLYVLAPMNNIANAYYYNKSFSVNQDYTDIESDTLGIGQYKSIQHDYLDTNNIITPINFIYKNCYTLNGTIATYNKVSEEDARAIEENVRTALYRRFNAREVDFGTEIDYYDILETIEGADARIRYVHLNQPEYVTKVMTSDDDIGSVATATNLTADLSATLLAKMISKGNVQLFKFDKEYNYEFGQTSSNVYDSSIGGGIASITTETTIPSTVVQGDNGYTIQANENVQLFTASLITEVSYTAYVNMRLANTNGNTINVSANSYHVLTSNEYLFIDYVDSNNVERRITYTSTTDNPVIIQPTFDTSGISYTIQKNDENGNQMSCYMLSGSEAINIVFPNITTFGDAPLDCLWFTNTRDSNGNYILFDEYTPDDSASNRTITQDRILQNNEYFIYTNSDRNALVILSSGTLLRRTINENNSYAAMICTNSLNVADITASGQSAISSNEWFRWWSNTYGILSAHELSIVSLGEGAVIGGTVGSDVTNDPIIISNPKYKETADSEWITLPTVSLGDEVSSQLSDDLSWHIQSRLNLSCSQSEPQTLTNNQKVIISYVSGAGEGTSPENSTISGVSILTNTPLSISGGQNVDTSIMREDGSLHYDLGIYTYTEASDFNFVRNETSGYIELTDLGITPTDLPFSFSNASSYYMIPIIKVSSNQTITVTSTVTGTEGGTIALFNGSFATDNIDWGTSITLNDGVNYVIVRNITTTTPSDSGTETTVNSPSALSFTATATSEGDSNDIVYVGVIHKISNDSLGWDMFSDEVVETVRHINADTESSITCSDILGKVVGFTELYTFDYLYEVPQEDALDLTVLDSANKNNVLTPAIMWDINHICNKFIIAQMDTVNSSITVANSSKY